MSGGVPKRISISRTQSNTPSKAGNVMAKKAIVLCNGTRSRRAMCNRVQTRAKYCPTPCKTGSEKCVPVEVQSTGAIVSQIGKITLLTFNTSGTFTLPPNFGKDIEYLIVGGGGSGGVGKLTAAANPTTMGGGGGGAVKTGTIPASTLSSITTPFIVTVGAGSPGLYSYANSISTNIPYLSPSGWATQTEPPLAPPDATSSIINNSASSFTSISARPGFNGGITFLDPSGTAPPGATTALATRGGSSGIINPGIPSTPGNPGANGATSTNPNRFYAPGGGGGGGAGTTPSNPASGAPAGTGGKGGKGIGSTITGTLKYYGGGGGGGGVTGAGARDGGAGGLGGGGRGVSGITDGSGGTFASNIGRINALAGLPIPAAVNGTPNTGGGGGGVSPSDNTDEYNSGAGGSGVVILRYVNDC